jgi:hypothetical protein
MEQLDSQWTNFYEAALWGELALEEAMELSQDRLRNE